MTEPYCEAQVGGMECGRPVSKWGHQCIKHDPQGLLRHGDFPLCSCGNRSLADLTDLPEMISDEDYQKCPRCIAKEALDEQRSEH